MTTKAVGRVSPAAVAQKLRSAAARAPTTPIQRAKANGWRAPAITRGGAGGGGAAYAYDEGSDYEVFDDGELPQVPPPDDGEDDELEGINYADYFPGGQLAGWTDDLQKIGVDLAKGAASGALTTVARGLSPTVTPKAPPPPPPGMSTTAKLAIGAAVAVPVLYLLTRRRGSAPTPVAA